MKKVLSIAGVILLMASALSANSSFFGMSGLILTPDDQVVETSQLNLTANYVDFDGGSGWTAGGAFGILPKLEVSGAFLDDSYDTEFVANAKYKLLSESDKYPAVTVGIADAFGKIYNDPSFFVVVGKELASAFDSFGNNSGFSLRASVGIGTELYKGIFAGLDWGITEKFDVLGEYVHEGIYGDDTFNVAAQYKIDDNFSVKAGLLDMDDIFCGVNYTVSTFENT